MTKESIYKKLLSAIGNPYGVCGLMGNLKAESAMNARNLQNSGNKALGINDEQYVAEVDSGKRNFIDNRGFGLAQWTSGGRKTALLNFAKARNASIGDTEMQIDFLIHELSTSYKSVLSVLKCATSVREASDVVVKKFERPANQSESVLVKRASYGQEYFNELAQANSKEERGEANMGNYASKVVEIALAEVGYLEKKSNKNLDDKTANVGSANYTKYGRDMHDLYPSVMDFPAYWCDAFVDWCFQKAYGVSNAKGLLGGNFNDYTPSSANLYKKKNAYYKKNPKVGDQIFFHNGTRICHTGIVYQVDSKYVYTIEGNTSSGSGVVANGGCVAKKKYLLTNSKIDGYGRPKYDVEEAKKEVYTGNSIVAYLNSIGMPSDFNSRKGYAKQYGITCYSGTAEQNIKLLNLMRGDAKVEEKPVEYYPKYTGSSCSIVVALMNVKVDSSKTNRKKIAVANGIANYSGTGAQNSQMLKLLKQGKLKKA